MCVFFWFAGLCLSNVDTRKMSMRINRFEQDIQSVLKGDNNMTRLLPTLIPPVSAPFHFQVSALYNVYIPIFT